MIVEFLEELVRASQQRALDPPTTTTCSINDLMQSPWMAPLILGYSHSYVMPTWPSLPRWFKHLPKPARNAYWWLRRWKVRLSPPVYPEPVEVDEDEGDDE